MQRALLSRSSIVPLLGLAAVAALLAACTSAAGAPSSGADRLHTPRAWALDEVWYDGRAEKCVYEASRPIYGEARRYLATAYTNKQRMDPATTTKAAGGDGREVFKHHWSERAPTERYDYDLSTATFLATDDLGLFKLTAATQEDCGASFKQVWQEGDALAWWDSVYFPAAGMRSGRLAADVVAEDGLPLLLRNFPFDDGAGAAFEVALLRSQRSTRQVPFEPVAATLTYVGREDVDVPLGTRAAHRVELALDGGERRATYWLAADAALGHVLLRYAGADGLELALRSRERTAYWER